MVSSDHDDPDPRLVAFTNRLGNLGARRVLQAGKARKDEIFFESSVLPLNRQGTIRQSQDPHPLFSHGLLCGTDSLPHIICKNNFFPIR